MVKCDPVKFLSALFLSALFFLCGCVSSDVEVKYYTMDELHDVIDIVRSNGEVKFSVEENVTTGFAWEAESDSMNYEVVINHQPADSNLCGAPGKAYITVRATGDDPVEVTFLYRRSFEADKPPVKQFTVRLSR